LITTSSWGFVNSTPPAPTEVFGTVDAGRTWQPRGSPQTTEFATLDCISTSCAEITYTGDDEYSPYETSGLATSADGGTTWSTSEIPASTSVLDAVAAAGHRWIAVGGNDLNGPLILTG
jgi:hypothetical protein